MKRKVEFYVLWVDKTWTAESVTLEGDEAGTGDEDCIDLARARIGAEYDESRLVVAIGPLYHLGELEAE